MRAYGWTPDFVRLKITSAQGWVYYNWAKENEMTVLGANYELKTPGYIGQEKQKILKQNGNAT